MTNSPLQRYFIRFAYHGEPFSGWQKQPNAPSVQETMEGAMQTVLKKETQILGAGRTDTGVHAKEMYAHFDGSPELDLEALQRSLNGILPGSIAIYSIKKVKPDVSARFDATSRSYEYLIIQTKNPFWQDGAYFFPQPLDVHAMRKAAAAISEYQHFSAFCKAGAQNKTDICKIESIGLTQEGDLLKFEITANRFLRNMVRAIVGTLMEIGRGMMPADSIHEIIQSKDRRNAGFSVPAKGLYLTRVVYPETIYL